MSRVLLPTARPTDRHAGLMSIVIQVLAATGGGFNLIVLAMALERTTALGDRAFVDVRLAALAQEPSMSVVPARSGGRR